MNEEFAHDGKRVFFTATDLDAIVTFGLRNIDQAGGGDLVGTLLVIPRPIAKRLKASGLLHSRPIPQHPGKIEWIFEPGPARILNLECKWIYLPASFFE